MVAAPGTGTAQLRLQHLGKQGGGKSEIALQLLTGISFPKRL